MDIENFPLIIVKIDNKGIIKEINPATSRILGYSGSYFLGKFFIEVFSLFEEESQKQGDIHLFEHAFKTATGEEKYLSWKIFSSDTEEQTAIAWDITSYKQKNEGMLSAKKEAEAASQAKSDFIAHTSHELRTPLNAVIGYSEMLLDEVEDADPIEVKHDLEKINTAAKHLLSLINSVLDLSKIEAGKMELFNEDFELSNLIMEVGATVETLVQKKRNQMEITYPDSAAHMYADRTKLREILFNLLSNACKFTERGRVWLRAKIIDATLCLEIEDNGCGMSEDELKKIFVPYSQVGGQKKKPGTGTGLGLMLCKKLSEMMGGHISVSSQYNKGTIFTVVLPLVYKTPSKEKVRASDIVLVIDDDLAVHEIIRHVLKKESLKIVSAMNGEEGLKRAKECQPLAIILDLIMPVMDGWEVLVKLKEDPQLKEIPVVISTGDDSVAPQARLSIKVDEYLIKPINSSLLIAVLKRYRPLANEDKQTLLVVDDDKETRNIVIRIAEKEGWMTMEAANGNLALKSLQQKRPNLILLDLMMPEMNGFEFVQKFRRQDELKAIPIVVLTSKDLSKDERKYLGGFAHTVLEKGKRGIDDLEEIIKEIGRHDE